MFFCWSAPVLEFVRWSAACRLNVINLARVRSMTQSRVCLASCPPPPRPHPALLKTARAIFLFAVVRIVTRLSFLQVATLFKNESCLHYRAFEAQEACSFTCGSVCASNAWVPQPLPPTPFPSSGAPADHSCDSFSLKSLFVLMLSIHSHFPHLLYDLVG